MDKNNDILQQAIDDRIDAFIFLVAKEDGKNSCT